MKPKRFLWLFFLSLLYIPLSTHSQAVISSAGNSDRSNEIQLDWTLGETAISIYSFSDGLLTEGFHQANPESKTLHNPKEEKYLSVHIFPNPVSSSFTMTWKSVNGEEGAILSTRLVDIYGKEMSRFELKHNSPSQLISLSDESSGIYFLHLEEISTGQKSIQKIIKI